MIAGKTEKIMKGSAMKTHHIMGLVGVLTLTLFLCSPAHAIYYQIIEETIDSDVYTCSGGDGSRAEPGAGFTGGNDPWAQALVELGWPQDVAYAGAYAYRDYRIYTTNYDPLVEPHITGHVSGEVRAFAFAMGPYQTSDYWTKVVSSGYVNGNNVMAYVDFNEPTQWDAENYPLVDDPTDMSYNGAIMYSGNLALAQAEAYETTGGLTVCGRAETDNGWWISSP
jgi:hypothetical protein